MKTAYDYVRFSKAVQAKGDSISRQTEATRRWLEQHKELVLDTSLDLRDLGVSSYTGDNYHKGALGRFFEACEKGYVKPGSALLVEALDRLSRQKPRRTVTLLNRLLDEYKIEIHFVAAERIFKPDDDTAVKKPGEEEDDGGVDLMMAVAWAMEAHRSSANKSRWLRHAWSKIRERARKDGTVMRAALPWWLLIENGKIVAPPDRAGVIKRIYQLTASGLSSLQIARTLNDEKTPTWRPQKLWNSSRVRDVVRSIATEGTLVPTAKTRDAGRAYEPITGYYPRIIEPELAAAARSVLARNARGSRGREGEGKRPSNLFRGLLRYKRKWLRHSTHPNGMPDPETGQKTYNGYYECIDELARKNRGLYCISAKQLEPIIIMALAELTPADLAPQKKNPMRERLAHLRGELAALQAKHANLVTAIEEGAKGVAARLNEVDKLIAAKTAEVSKAEILSARPVNETTRDLKPLVGKLHDPESRRMITACLRRLVKQIELGDDLADLFLPAEVQRDFIKERVRHPTGPLDDPTPKRARRPLWCLISFVSGAHRLIVRPAKKGGIYSIRVEPPPIKAKSSQAE